MSPFRQVSEHASHALSAPLSLAPAHGGALAAACHGAYRSTYPAAYAAAFGAALLRPGKTPCPVLLIVILMPELSPRSRPVAAAQPGPLTAALSPAGPRSLAIAV